MTSPPSGLNLTALWTRLTKTWPSRASSPRTGGKPVWQIDDEPQRPGGRRTAAGARRTRPTTRARSTSSRRTSGPPLSIRARSSSSLTIWTRWPVSTSILPIRSRILAGTRGARRSASRASVSASRLTVVSGVRSSCERLSMNSARICWRRRSSETSSRTTQTPPAGERRARTTRTGPSWPRSGTRPRPSPCPGQRRGAARNACRRTPRSPTGRRSTRLASEEVMGRRVCRARPAGRDRAGGCRRPSGRRDTPRCASAGRDRVRRRGHDFEGAGLASRGRPLRRSNRSAAGSPRALDLGRLLPRLRRRAGSPRHR